jgi:hypothetical protein
MALYAYGTNLVGRRKKLPDLMNCGISIYLHCSRIDLILLSKDSLILDMSVNHLTGNRRLELEPPVWICVAWSISVSCHGKPLQPQQLFPL